MRGSRPSMRAPHAPMVAPQCTIGPSRPTEAPKPREMALSEAALMPSRKLMRPRLSAEAAMTLATPGGRGRVGYKIIIKPPTITPPTTGPANRRHQGCSTRPEINSSSRVPRASHWTQEIASRNTTAASPTSVPTTSASNAATSRPSLAKRQLRRPCGSGGGFGHGTLRAFTSACRE